MKLTSQKAREFFAKIANVYSDNRSLQDKIAGRDGLSFIFMKIVEFLTTQGIYANQKERIKAILNDPDMTPGPDLTKKIEALQNDLYHYYKKMWAPTEADYKRCVRYLSEFLAFYSETQIPDDVRVIYDNEAKGTKGAMNLQIDDLIDNPTTRVPVVLCLDTSGSMYGDKIKELNNGVKQFFQAVADDDIAKYSVELCIVTFSSVAKKILDFSSIEKQVSAFSNIELVASGNTAMGSAVNLSLDLLEKRKKEYQEKGVDYWQPWLVLMTDGQPTESITAAATRTVKLIEEKKLTVFPIGIGEGASMSHLAEFSAPGRPPLRLKGLMLSEFFTWLGKSVKSTSQSSPGTKVKLPPIGWAEL